MGINTFGGGMAKTVVKNELPFFLRATCETRGAVPERTVFGPVFGFFFWFFKDSQGDYEFLRSQRIWMESLVTSDYRISSAGATIASGTRARLAHFTLV